MEKQQILQALCNINKQIKAVTKSQKNKDQNFMYRGIDDIANELHDLFAANEVIIIPEVLNKDRTERKSKYGTALFDTSLKIKYTFFSPDGSSISAIVEGEAMDTSDKGTNKAMSIALKYALLQMFLIPTEEQKDPDAETHEVRAEQKDVNPKTLEVKQSARAEKGQITDKAFEKALTRISTGEYDLIEKIKGSFILSQQQMNELEKATPVEVEAEEINKMPF